jgi:hypothetical protein
MVFLLISKIAKARIQLNLLTHNSHHSWYEAKITSVSLFEENVYPFFSNVDFNSL